MTIRSGSELRSAYLEFFRTHKTLPHPVVPSAPLIPPDDPTLLFTSAGMVQFKALYSGTVPLPYPRAATVQKCLRAGGKGSDLENVGKTLRHHTFFEMLGNFSFGDYFKREAIHMAWEFCTSPAWMGLPKERMFPTIYGPTTEETDREAEAFWGETDMANPTVPLDAKENFWGPAGDTGACGPCSEVKYFMGTEAELAEARSLARSGEAGLRELGRRIVEEGDQYLEIWNMVFPQFDQQRDGSRPPLRNRGIDTGAGLERMTTALLSLQNKAYSPYETDLLQPIVSATSSMLGVAYVPVKAPGGSDAEVSRRRLAINAISDHIRALVFCLAEGITPSNIGRGYVVRRIQRRALRFASLLGMDRPFMATLYDAVADAMGAAYPEITRNPDFIRKALRIEEETFLRTRERGERLLQELLDGARQTEAKTISGADAFRLWDTYGFPVDLTVEIAEDAGLSVDLPGYEAARAAQKAEAKKSAKGSTAGAFADVLDALGDEHGATEFVGYTYHPEPTEATVLAAHLDGEGKGFVVLDRTPFYAESGGQVGDTGTIAVGDAEFEVSDTQKTPVGLIHHLGRMRTGRLEAGTRAVATVDLERRQSIMRHHSTVHLLQNALKRHLGDHVTQAGSFVGPDYARFDFSHTEPVSRETLRALQAAVNRLILEDHPVTTDVLPIEEARRRGAIAPFGEKYGALVRVVQMGPSIEFCGGTHIERTSQALRMRIVGESSIASGVRRIELVVADRAAEADASDQFDIAAPLQSALAAKGTEAIARVEALSTKARDLEREIAALRVRLAVSELRPAIEKAEVLLDGDELVSARYDGLDGAGLRQVAEALREAAGPDSVVVLAGVVEDKVAIACAVGAGAQRRYPAGKVVNAIAGPLGGKGGGKPDAAQAGARDASKLNEVMAQAGDLVRALG